MPDERWLDGHTGDETRPRAGFGEELGDRLRGAWRGEVEATVGPPADDPSPRRLGIVLSLVACVLVLAFVALAVTRDSRHERVGTPTTVVSGSSTTAPPTTAAPTTTTGGFTPTTLPSGPPTTREPSAVVAVPADADQRAVFDYLTALSQQRWADAATALRGSIDDTDRADLRPIFSDLPDVALGLRRWCADGGACQQPSALDTPQPGWVSAAYRLRGRKLMQWFQVSTFEGKTTVRGLPIKVPAEADVNQVVQCEVTDPVSVVPADLNGDGWFEQIVTDQARTVHVCDTTLSVAPLTIPPPAGGVIAVYPVDVAGNGVDRLIIGFQHGDGFQGGLYSMASKSLQMQAAVYTSGLTSTTIGCETFNGPGRALAQVTWKFEGGTTQETATGISFTYTPVWPLDQQGSVDSSSPGEPPTSPQAVAAMNGVCGDRPIFTH